MMIFSNRNGTFIKKNKKTGFTMIELIIISMMIATGLIGIVVTINYGIDFAERTKINVIAINMAREGVEGVYNVRDSNRQRRGIKKEKCWLKIDPLFDLNTPGCEDDPWMENLTNYVLLTKTTGGTGYNYLRRIGIKPLNIKDKIDEDDNSFAMCQNASNQWYNCAGVGSPYIKEGRFFRAIKGIGLYDKETASTTPLTCTDGSDIMTCGSSTAKEYRFCSTVQYIAGGIGEVELCGVLTNFLK